MGILQALQKAIESRDPYTSGHAARVTAFADVIACRLGWDERRLAVLRLGAALHDVGKLVVSPAVLRKPGPLSDAEMAEVRRHPAAGAQLVELIRQLRQAVPGVLYHHERWDGGGYPTGRAGSLIPAEARILAVADSFDAMTSDRPYRCALTPASALEEVERGAGSQFDPDVACVFIDAWESGAFAVSAALRAAAS